MPHAPSMHHGRQDPLDPRTPLRTAPHRAAPPHTAPGRHDRTPARPSNRRRARSTSVIYTEPTGAVTFGRSSLRVAARKRPHPAIVRADQSVQCPAGRLRFHRDCHPLTGRRVTTSRDIILEPRPSGIEGRPISVARHPHRFNGSGVAVPPREKRPAVAGVARARRALTPVRVPCPCAVPEFLPPRPAPTGFVDDSVRRAVRGLTRRVGTEVDRQVGIDAPPCRTRSPGRYPRKGQLGNRRRHLCPVSVATDDDRRVDPHRFVT